MKKKGFTLIELLVVIAIIAMLLAILMPALSKVKKIAQRVVCGTNLKGLGTAQTVYANDYEDRYTVQQYGACTQDFKTQGWNDPAKVWANGGPISIGASLYLLVREADVSPKSFVCPSSAETVFDGKNPPPPQPGNLDITELWDFGHPSVGPTYGPRFMQSYAYHSPYNRFSADGARGAAFAFMADKNPLCDEKLKYAGAQVYAPNPQAIADNTFDLIPDWDPAQALKGKYEVIGANSQPHGREGQNVVFGDGHSNFEKRTDVGIQHDNIYTRWPGATPGPTKMRRGIAPVKAPTVFADLAPAGQNDSFLVNDSRRDQSGQ